MQPSLDGHELLKSWGQAEGPVYPGHPLVVATLVMNLFPSYASASRLTETGNSEALCDSRIPGCGGHVSYAMHLLKSAAGGASPDVLVQMASDYWTSGQAGGHTKNVDAGIKQANAVEPHFRSALSAWDFSTFGDKNPGLAINRQ